MYGFIIKERDTYGKIEYGCALVRVNEINKTYKVISEFFFNEDKDKAKELLILHLKHRIELLSEIKTESVLDKYILTDMGTMKTNDKLRMYSCKNNHNLVVNTKMKYCPVCMENDNISRSNLFMQEPTEKICIKCNKRFVSNNDSELCPSCASKKDLNKLVNEYSNLPIAINNGFSNHDCCSIYTCPVCGQSFNSYQYDTIKFKAPCGHSCKLF